MTLLLDTHVLLWWLVDSPKLSARAREVIASGDNRLLFSVASSWEIAVKLTLGRIRLPGPLSFYLPERLAAQGIEPLPIENVHAFRVAELPPHHHDPFDRLLLAQAQIEEVPIVSDDQRLVPYGVPIVW